MSKRAYQEDHQFDEDAMPCICSICNGWFDLSDGSPNPRKDNEVICEGCADDIQEEVDREEEIEDLLTQIGEALLSIEEAKKRLKELKYIEPTGNTGELSGNPEPLAASEKSLSMKDICEHIVKADLFEKPLTAEEIFNYSTTGELSRVFEWYAIACKVLGYSASKNGTAASDGLPCPPYCPKDEL